jgi:hypothetical protein
VAADPDLQLAMRHFKLRWAGAPLLITGACILLYAMFRLPFGGGLGLALMSVGGALTGLASFGSNHDTALALAARVRAAGQSALPPELAEELEEELARDRGATLALRPHSPVAMALPFFSMAFQSFLVWRLLRGA